MLTHLSGNAILPLRALQEQLEVLYENGDRSVRGREVIDRWEVKDLRPEGFSTVCVRHLSAVNVDLTVRVDYTVKDNLVEKKITLHQRNAASLYIGLTQAFTHPQTRHIWSFDAVQNEDACIYGSRGKQAFPAAGMILEDGSVLGFLMDTGTANGWSRWHLRRTARGNAPVVSAYDPLLMEELPGHDGIRFRAGQYAPVQDIPMEEVGADHVQVLCRKGCAIVFEFDCAAPCCITASEGRVLSTHRFDEPGPQVLHLAPLDHNGLMSLRWESNAPVTPVGVYEQKNELRPWHRLEQDVPLSYRYFFYADRCEVTLRNLRKGAQVHLAEALGFCGTTAEKILYADFRMLNWLAEPGMKAPLCVPSIDYFEMYFRDIFWSANGVDDPELNRTLLQMVGRTMDERGWVDNIITPYFGSIEKVDNEINYLYVLWNCLNQKRFGHPPDMEKVIRVVQLVMNRYDPARRGEILTNNPQSLMDVMWQEHPCRFAVSQGYYSLTMKAALALGVPGVDAAYVERCREAYQAYYGADRHGRKYLQSFPGNGLGEDGTDLEIISCLDLEPEFLSLYIFGESLLGRQIVLDTLDRMPVYSGCLMPIIACADGSFFTRERNPFNDGHYWEGGRYANGGSYLRPQYIVLAAGKYHGWPRADELMAQRLKAEFETCPDAPVSIEYLHALGDPEKSSPHKVFAWNVFVNQINHWIRTSIDPEFQAGDDIR